MHDYNDALRQEIILTLKDESGDSSFLDRLVPIIRMALQAAQDAGRITIPEEAFSHSMVVAHAIDELRNPKKYRWHLDQLVRWIAHTHYMEVSTLARKALRDNPELDVETTADDILARGKQMIEDGNFGADFSPQTDLSRSNWNGLNHDLHIRGWAFQFKESRIGPMRMGSILRPLLPAPVPQVIQIEMRFPTGRLLVASDAIIQDLNEQHTKMRQATEFKGLQAEIAVTEEILYENAMLAYGVCSSQFIMRRSEDGLALVHPGDGRTDDDYEDSFMLDYRHMTIADEAACIEALRENWKDKDDVLQSRYELARAACELSVQEIEVKPGRYLVTIPANYQRFFSPKDSPAAQEDFTAFSMKWLSER